MITDFKKRIFCELSGAKLKEVDADDPMWIQRINAFLASRSGLPPPNDPAEYAAAFEAVYPTPHDRRNYISLAVQKGTPSYAHRVLAGLITTGRVPCVFTTNFDSLVETAATVTDQFVAPDDRANLSVSGIDNAERAMHALGESRALLAKIHGDYQSVSLKNTTDELREQDTQMRTVLTSACSAIPVLEMPRVARRITLERSVTTPDARQMLRDADVWAIVASRGKEIAAFGNDEELARAFGPAGGRLDGTVNLVPADDSWALGLLYDALTRAVCRNRPLRVRWRRSGHAVMVRGDSDKETPEARETRLSRQARLRTAYSTALYGKTPEGYPFQEGVELHLEQAADRWWLTFEPATFVDVPYPERTQDRPDSETNLDRPRFVDPTIDWRRERWAQRYNHVWAAIIDAWADMLAGDGSRVLLTTGVPQDEGIDAVFKVSPITAWSRPSHEHAYFQRNQ
ncbi:SIR2 family protein [Burkholderia glumae]